MRLGCILDRASSGRRLSLPHARGLDEWLAILRQIVAARSFHRSSHRPTQVTDRTGRTACRRSRRGEASRPFRSDGFYRRPRRKFAWGNAAIADRDLSSPRSDAVMLGRFSPNEAGQDGDPKDELGIRGIVGVRRDFLMAPAAVELERSDPAGLVDAR